MTEVLMSAVLGYGFGQLSPAAIISHIKKKDLREHGTGNLGATNTFLVFGKVYGITVMLVDVLKAYLAVKIAKILFSKVAIAGLIAGCFAVIGHIFPAHLGFHGGKGVASFAGLVLAYDIRVLLILLVIGATAMLITNFGPAAPISAAVLFPFILWFRTKSLVVFGAMALIGGLIIYRHKENYFRMKQGTEIMVNEFAGKCDELQDEDLVEEEAYGR